MHTLPQKVFFIEKPEMKNQLRFNIIIIFYYHYYL